MFSQRHSFHLVDSSPWPLVVSVGVFLVLSLLVASYTGVIVVFEVKLFGVVYLVVGVLLWGRDIIREGLFEGKHVSSVQRGFSLGVVLFIISELMLFAAFLVSYLYYGLNADVSIGGVWPPNGIMAIEALGIPTLNTVILLSSGCSVTYGHHALIVGSFFDSCFGLGLGVFLAIIFMWFQWFEYCSSSVCISDSVYGSMFYLLTGFHGAHVMLGGVLLFIGLFRVLVSSFTNQHHFGLESSLWYWHFVDVVWLLLYVLVYVMI